MALEGRLRRWVDAGLIDVDQAQRIRDYEGTRGRPLLVYAISGLGGLAIAIGLVAIVAANWDVIPPHFKLLADLFWIAVVGAAFVRFAERGPGWAREASILVLYGLVIASIALIGQVYQLGGEAHEAMGLWTLFSAVLMTRGHSVLIATVWLLGIEATVAAWLVWIGNGPWGADGYALAGVYLAPLGALAAGRSAWLRRVRPRFAVVFERLGWLELVLAGTAGTFAFYQDTCKERWFELWVGLFVSGAITVWIWRGLPRGGVGNGARWLLGVCLLLYHVPFAASPGGWDVVAALTFIGLWLLVAMVVHRAGMVRELNLATAIVGVRILVVYFEIFGSLLSTGVGLVTGGALTLALVWLWARKRRDFGRELAAGSPSSREREPNRE